MTGKNKKIIKHHEERISTMQTGKKKLPTGRHWLSESERKWMIKNERKRTEQFLFETQQIFVESWKQISENCVYGEWLDFQGEKEIEITFCEKRKHS